MEVEEEVCEERLSDDVRRNAEQFGSKLYRVDDLSLGPAKPCSTSEILLEDRSKLLRTSRDQSSQLTIKDVGRTVDAAYPTELDQHLKVKSKQ